MSTVIETALRTRPGRGAHWAPLVRWTSGAIFVVFGIGKFSAHAQEVESFQSYGLPAPEAFVYAVGARIGEGEVLPSLTLAPALLIAMLFLLWTGPRARSLDEWVRAR
jgi:uncharacterized membrane protein YphA (DoxX/SURF4 family)